MEERYKIMVVDDEDIVRELAASRIPWEEYGVAVVKTAANAMEALEYLEQNEVDLMLVDIRMPVMSGLELLKRVRTMNRNVDVVILSGFADFEYAREALCYGAKDYILKPFDENTLVNAVLKCCEGHSREKFMSAIRNMPVFGEIEEQQNNTGRYSLTVRRIIKVVEEELGYEELSLKWISSQKLFLNENYLSKVFQKEVGQKFSSFLLERRMLKAMKLLAGSEKTVAEVAEAAGFGMNSQYFSSTFKKYTGYTPTEYRKNIR